MSGGRVEISLLKNDLEQLAPAILRLRAPVRISNSSRSSLDSLAGTKSASLKSLPQRKAPRASEGLSFIEQNIPGVFSRVQALSRVVVKMK